MADSMNIGGIIADLSVDSTNLDRGLANGRKAMEAMENELRRLQKDFAAGAIGAADLAERIDALTATQTRLATAMNAAYTTTTKLNTGMQIVGANASRMSGQMGMALMQIGYMADDAQYGFHALVNNIQPLVYGLSGSTGLAAAAQITAVSGYQLYTHWHQVMDAMGLGLVLTEAQQMEDLGNKTHKTADETARLNKFKREQAEIQKLLDAPSKEEKDQSAAVAAAVAEIGGRELKGGILRAREAEGFSEKATPDEIAAIDKASQEYGAQFQLEGADAEATKIKEAALQKVWDAMIKRRAEEDSRAADKLLTDAVTPEGADARKMLQGLIERHPGAFPPGALKDVIEIDPKERERQAGIEAQAERNAKAFQERLKETEKAERERTKLIADRAKDLAKGKLGADALGAALDSDEVEKTLIASGEDPEKARGMAEDVAARMRKDASEGIGKRVREKGLGSFDEGRQDLLREESEKQAKEEEQRRRKAVSAAQAALPGIDEIAERLAGGAAMAGGGKAMEAAIAQLKGMLKAGGLSDESASLGASGLLSEATGDLRKKVLHEMLDPDQERNREKRKNVEVLQATDLAARFQASVGGQQDETKKQSGYQEQMVKHLAQMASQKGVNLRVVQGGGGGR